MKRVGIYCRVSTEDQEREGTSLQTQLEYCLKYCNDKDYDVTYRFSEAYSGLSLERPKLNELRELIRSGQIEVVVVYCLDRLSRDPTHGVILTQEMEKYHVTMEAVTEDIDNSELGKLINYVRGYASKVEAEKIRERTMRGKRAKAKMGMIPSGFGRYGGYLGLRYDKKVKKLVHVPGQIEVAAEILTRYISDPSASSSSLARDLQRRNITGVGGGIIHRSSVSRVLAKARAYAGLLDWNGIEIRGKVENPIITEEHAAIVAERLKCNQEKSRGFGRRKWLTGRVFCQICGRRFNLDSKKGCYCNGADNRNPTKCPSPKVGLTELSALAYGTMITALSEPDTVIQRAKEDHDNWETQKQLKIELRHRKEDQTQERQKRRRLLSFQHENGGLTDEEYLKKLSDIQKEEVAAVSFAEFLEPEPPTLEQVKQTYSRLATYKPLRLHFLEVLRNPQDEHAEQLAEEVGLKIIIGPPKIAGQKYSAQVLMDLTIASEEVPFPSEENPWAMVSQSSLRYARRRPQSPGHA